MSVPSNVVVEWDLDNDGDFDEPVEDVTDFVLLLETFTGRDWPSLLTGKAGPGRLRATLNNDDDRFGFFNQASPLNQAPFSLRTGRRLRVRTTTAGNPDPVLLARDRFNRADIGAIVTAETGQSWVQPLAPHDFSIVNMQAVLSGQFETDHIAVLDVGQADYYAQVRLAVVGTGSNSGSIGDNELGLVYRFQDTANYSLAVLDTVGLIRLIDVVAGSRSTVFVAGHEPYDDMTIGVLVQGASVTLYHEGVPIHTDTAIQTGETQVGIYGLSGDNNVRVALDDFYVWTGLPAQTEGILWTGDVGDVFPEVTPGPRKLARLEGRGWLARAAGQTIRPPATLNGRSTGTLVGETLARAKLLHPPGQLDQGDVTTGAFGMRDANAIEVARRFEETEFGFLHESQEGYIAFDSRSARDGSVPQAVFSDAPAAELDYHSVVLRDWSREVVNRVTAGVARSEPTLGALETHTQTVLDSGNPLTITMPSSPSVNPGDLLLVIVSAIGAGNANFGTLTWMAPSGWRELLATGERTSEGQRVFAKVAKGDEDGEPFTFAMDSSSTFDGCAAARVLTFSGWYGDLSGVVAMSGLSSVAEPELAFPLPWGREPARFVGVRPAYNNAGGAFADVTTAARGYFTLTSTTVASAASKHVALATCHARDVTSLPLLNWREAGDTTEVYDNSLIDPDTAILVAVRGRHGDPPGSGTTVTVDDVGSQMAHGSVSTHRNSSNLFANLDDASSYARLVLGTFAGDRPILQLQFFASASTAHRTQAVQRRVSDKITVVADNQAGLGIHRDFFVESIGHRWDQGNELWVVTWELSPAPEGLVLTGTAGDYASTPDTAALDITGDIDLRALITTSNWVTQRYVVSKYDTSTDQRSYALSVAGNSVRLNWSTDGVSFLGITSGIEVPKLSRDSTVAIRATLDVDDGQGNAVLTFYYGPGSGLAGPWTLLQQVNTAATSIFASTADGVVGGVNDGTVSVFDGVVHAVEVRDGIDGTIVANPDFAAQAGDTTSFTDSAGRLWTVNGNARIA